MAVTIIAEAGVNHNGDLDMARRLVDAAAAAGADIVKFQSFKASRVASVTAPRAEYQIKAMGGGETQTEMLRRLELSEDAHLELLAHCRMRGIQFLSSPFDLESLAFLTDRCGLETIKLASGEVVNGPLLHAAARSGRRIILSTGMSTLAEVGDALAVLAHGMVGEDSPNREAFVRAYASQAGMRALEERVVLLHCTTEYPAPVADTNLQAMTTMARAFGLSVGYSDHTDGIVIPAASVALGAVIIEKHLTLDRTLPGPDHAASLEPLAFAAMVTGIRQVEAALGDGIKRPMPSEWRNRPLVRRGMVAARDIEIGQLIDADSILVVRPENGASPLDYWKVVGLRAERAYAAGEPLLT